MIHRKITIYSAFKENVRGAGAEGIKEMVDKYSCCIYYSYNDNIFYQIDGKL